MKTTKRYFLHVFFGVSFITLALISDYSRAQVSNPGSPATAGTGLSQVGSTLSVKYGSTAGTAVQGNQVVAVPQGGTGLATLTTNNLMLGNGSSNVAFVAPSATTGYALLSNGSGSAPSFQVIPSALVSSVFGQTGAIPNLSGDATTTGSSAVTLANTSTARTDIGLGTGSTVTFGSLTGTPVSATTLSASSTVSGTGFSTYLASPPAIGGTAASTGAFTTLSASSTVSGAGFSTYLASPPAIGGTAAAAGNFTTLGTSNTYTAGAAINYAAPVTLASASSVAIGGAASNNVTISGTTTITSFDTVASGVERNVKFSGALTLTYNSTSLILPGKLNITTVAGDYAVFRSLGSGNWECISYTAINSGGLFHAPAFIVYSATAANLSNGTDVIYPFDTIVSDTNSAYNTGTYSYAAPIAGYYEFDMSMSINGVAPFTNTSFFVYKNGARYKLLADYATNNLTINGSIMMLLNAGDTVSVYMNVVGNTPVTLPSQLDSNFSGFYVRAP